MINNQNINTLFLRPRIFVNETPSVEKLAAQGPWDVCKHVTVRDISFHGSNLGLYEARLKIISLNYDDYGTDDMLRALQVRSLESATGREFITLGLQNPGIFQDRALYTLGAPWKHTPESAPPMFLGSFGGLLTVGTEDGRWTRHHWFVAVEKRVKIR